MAAIKNFVFISVTLIILSLPVFYVVDMISESIDDNEENSFFSIDFYEE